MQIISTQKVNCKDCNRCLRSCPVKAIGIRSGHARVVDEKCILCGKCVIECPQHAKRVTNEIPAIINAFKGERKVILSLDSSYPGAFSDYSSQTFSSKLQNIGFDIIEETAVGADVISSLYKDVLRSSSKTIISTCCPVVVNLIRKYYPSLVSALAPIVSPMVAHAKVLKQRYGNNAFIVYAGPCIASFAEKCDKNDCYIDAVLTFSQLRKLISVDDSDQASFSCLQTTAGQGKYFSVAGGIIKSVTQYDLTDTEVITVDGIEKCIELFSSLAAQDINPRFIEAFACSGGCIGGPATGSALSVPAKRIKVLEYANRFDDSNTSIVVEAAPFKRLYVADPVINDEPSELEIRQILNQTGKFSKVDEKNCGACGYSSCREKAIAVYQGFAENDLCLPYMRSKAESFADIIVEHALNGILVVNDNMIIQEFNSAVQKMFKGFVDLEKGMHLAQVLDCSDFVWAANCGEKVVNTRVEYGDYGIVTEQMIIPVPEHGLVIGIITDVTTEERQAQNWQQMKAETVQKATEIINKQMHVAQEIAGLLGETTAETKSALLELMWLLKDKEEN